MAVSGTLSAVGSGADAVLLSPVVVAVGAGDVYRAGAGGCVAYGCPLVVIFVGGGSDSRWPSWPFARKSMHQKNGCISGYIFKDCYL